MRLLHLSDLHLGKRVNGFSMIEDQEFILLKILNIIDDTKPEAIVIAGDVYDKSVPSEEAVKLFDNFIYKLSQRGLKVLIIAGNHDSDTRLALYSRIMNDKGIFLAPEYKGEVEIITLGNEGDKVNFYMLPFVKPSDVRNCFPEEEINSYTDAMRVAVSKMNINTNECNVLITHQFVTGATRSESEEISVGGTDNVDASVFSDFDYVALGHIHGPQNIGSERIRYCGTPLKYSFSEAGHTKSVTIVDIVNKELKVTTVPLIPKLDMREIRGTYLEVTARDNYKDTNRDDYIRVILTDEEDVPDAMAKLRVVYPNIMKLDYDNKRTRATGFTDQEADVDNKSELELFADLFKQQNDQELTTEQIEYIESIIESIKEAE